MSVEDVAAEIWNGGMKLGFGLSDVLVLKASGKFVQAGLVSC